MSQNLPKSRMSAFFRILKKSISQVFQTIICFPWIFSIICVLCIRFCWLVNRSIFKEYFRYPTCYVLIISCNSKVLGSKLFEPKLSKLKMFRIFEEPSKIHVLRITKCLKTIISKRYRVTRNDQNVTFLVSKIFLDYSLIQWLKIRVTWHIELKRLKENEQFL